MNTEIIKEKLPKKTIAFDFVTLAIPVTDISQPLLLVEARLETVTRLSLEQLRQLRAAGIREYGAHMMEALADGVKEKYSL